MVIVTDCNGDEIRKVNGKRFTSFRSVQAQLNNPNSRLHKLIWGRFNKRWPNGAPDNTLIHRVKTER